MLKSLLAAFIIAALAVGGMVTLKMRAPSYPNYSEACRKLHDPNPAIRKAAISDVFSKADLTATRTLLSIARDEDPGVRGMLDHALLSTRNPAAVEWLTGEGLVYPERWTRYYAVRVLWQEQRAACIPKLVTLLSQNYWQVQIAILEAIGESGQVAVAVEALGTTAAPGQNWEVRERAIKLLSSANSAPAATTLIEKALPPVGAPADPEAERAVESALATMTDPEALKVVAQGLGSADPARKILAVKVLGQARHLESVGKFKEIASDASAPTPLRVAALRSAVQAGAEDGVAFALKLLDGSEAALRLEAAYMLCEVPLSPETKANIRARQESETDWRVGEALRIAGGVK